MDSTHHQIDPTQPVTPYYSGDPTQQRYPEYHDYMQIIPPPPPPPRRSWKPSVVITTLLIVAALVFGGSLLFYLTNTHQLSPTTSKGSVPAATSAATSTEAAPSPTATIKLDYTASDIISDFALAGLRPHYIQYSQTIWSWSSDMYFVDVHATSVATFTDDSRCTGYCSPADLGLWVYASTSDAQIAYTEVGNDEVTKGSIPMIGTPPEFQHNRCLLLGASLNSVYVQVITKYCV